jgi:peptidoglycan L-alanyl-D-glutamate endopeptidase CwlK
MFKFGTGSIRNLKDVTPIMQELCERALRESDVDFSIICGFRNKEEQMELYSEGLSELDGTINISAHQLGYAVDILPYVIDNNGSVLDCWNYNNPKVRVAWLEVYRAFLREARLMSIDLELGLTYNINEGYDYPHIEIKE